MRRRTRIQSYLDFKEELSRTEQPASHATSYPKHLSPFRKSSWVMFELGYFRESDQSLDDRDDEPLRLYQPETANKNLREHPSQSSALGRLKQ